MALWPPLPTDPYPPLPPLPCPFEDNFGCPFCQEGIGFAQEEVIDFTPPSPEPTFQEEITLEEDQQTEETTEMEPQQENKLLEL